MDQGKKEFVVARKMFKEGERNVVQVLKACDKDTEKVDENRVVIENEEEVVVISDDEDENEVIILSGDEDKADVIVIADSGDEDERQGNGNSWQGEFLKFLELRGKSNGKT